MCLSYALLPAMIERMQSYWGPDVLISPYNYFGNSLATTVKNWGTGRTPSREGIDSLCEVTGVSMEWLIFGRGEPPRKVEAPAEAAPSPPPPPPPLKAPKVPRRKPKPQPVKAYNFFAGCDL